MGSSSTVIGTYLADWVVSKPTQGKLNDFAQDRLNGIFNSTVSPGTVEFGRITFSFRGRWRRNRAKKGPSHVRSVSLSVLVIPSDS